MGATVTSVSDSANSLYADGKFESARTLFESLAEKECLAALPNEFQRIFSDIIVQDNVDPEYKNLVKAADILSAYLKAIDELKHNNPEFEHVKEVYVEQAFVNYSLSPGVNLRAGLMLVPMGIINEYHEPTTFNGVERPSLDNAIVPTTWREIGIGVSGRIDSAALRYQAYIFNGFLSHDGTAGVLSGKKGLRGGRQKGAESTVDKFNFSSKLDFYGIPGLRLGLSGYFGRTQAVDDQAGILGRTVGVSMLGFDARYRVGQFSARTQIIQANLSDTGEYNTLTGKDLGKEISGYYLEAAYNLLPAVNKQRLEGFVRYEDFDTHAATAGDLIRNPAFHRKEWTTGLSYHLSPGSVFKADYQWKSTGISNSTYGQFNMGVGVWF